MREKPDHMKPVLKTGIPFVLSLAGWFVFSAMMRRKTRNRVPPETSLPQNKTNALVRYSDSLDSASLPYEEEEHLLTQTQVSDSLETLQFKLIDDGPDLEQEIISLNNQVSALQHREGELEEHFRRYCSFQEHDSALKELRNAVQYEIAHVNFLGLKVEIIETENRMLEAVLGEYPRVIEELELARLQMRPLQRKIKKLLRMKREASHVFRRQALVLREREAEISSNNVELIRRKREIEELEGAVAELRRTVDQLQMEKIEFMEKLELAENLNSSTPKMIAEDPNQQRLYHEELLTQIEQLQNDRAADIDELIYLRWINACLRYELMRNQEQRPEENEKEKQLFEEFSGNDEENNCEIGYGSENLLMSTEHGESSMDVKATRQAGQAKPMLLDKLKRWVRGKERRKRSCDEKENQEKCSGRCSVSEMAIEDFTARNSCSAIKPCFWVENGP